MRDNGYPIATICGSMKLFEAMVTVADELTRQGYLVLMPIVRKGQPDKSRQRQGLHQSINQRVAALETRDGKQYDHQSSRHLNATPISGEELDQMHRAKIDMADLVVVVTNFTDYVMVSDSHDLYFGESTTAEMEYTRQLGKPMKLARLERRDYRDTIIWLELPVDAVSA